MSSLSPKTPDERPDGAPAPRAERLDALPAHTLPGGLRLARADTHRARLLGLAGLDADALGAHDGLLFPRCRSIHTFWMRFALDLIWLDADGVPVRVDTGVAPRRLRRCGIARSVVEVRAGAGPTFAAALGRSSH